MKNRGSTYIDAQGRSHTLPLADRDVIVHDPNIGIDRKIRAGRTVPPELVTPYLETIGANPVLAGSGDPQTTAPVVVDVVTVQDLESIATHFGVDLAGETDPSTIVGLLLAADPERYDAGDENDPNVGPTTTLSVTELNKLNVADLQAYATNHNIDLGTATSKADMRAVIIAATSTPPVV